jgi:hypothetical protein
METLQLADSGSQFFQSLLLGGGIRLDVDKWHACCMCGGDTNSPGYLRARWEPCWT